MFPITSIPLGPLPAKSWVGSRVQSVWVHECTLGNRMEPSGTLKEMQLASSWQVLQNQPGFYPCQVTQVHRTTGSWGWGGIHRVSQETWTSKNNHLQENIQLLGNLEVVSPYMILKQPRKVLKYDEKVTLYLKKKYCISSQKDLSTILGLST